MSQSKTSEEEIDLMQVFKILKQFFIKILKQFFSILTFYKKKWIFFSLLIVIGAVIGYFIDRSTGATIYEQEVIIEPKHGSTSYLYSFIDKMPYRLGDERFVRSLGLEPIWAENIKSIKLEPVIVMKDVMNQLHHDYNDQTSYQILTDYAEEDMASEKFRNFYTHHRLIVFFKSNQEYNNKITESILKNISDNDYFRNQIDYKFSEVTFELKKNNASLQFIDQYLHKLTTDTTKNNQDVIILADETQTTTIAALLKQKASLLRAIKENKETLNLEKEVFNTVSDSHVVVRKKKIYSKALMLFPFWLFILVSIIYFIRYLYKELQRLVTSE